MLPTGPVANKWLRLAGRAIDLSALSILVAITWVLVGDAHKFWTDLFLAAVVIALYDACCTTWFGGTPGKRTVGLRVLELDRVGNVPFGTSLRRGATVGAMVALPVVGWAIWILTTFPDALGRGLPDRLANTIVVPDRFRPPAATRDLPGYADAVRTPRVSPLGRVGDLDVRYRARLRRLSDSRLLAAAVGLLALAVGLPMSSGWVILASSAAWIVIFIVHETLLVHREAATPGHRMAGLVILDRRTGQAPSTGRSCARAVVFALTVYVPLLWPILFVSLVMMQTSESGRGLHDYAGGTMVVADPRLDPETQRQRAMRMRLGRAG